MDKGMDGICKNANFENMDNTAEDCTAQDEKQNMKRRKIENNKKMDLTININNADSENIGHHIFLKKGKTDIHVSNDKEKSSIYLKNPKQIIKTNVAKNIKETNFKNKNRENEAVEKCHNNLYTHENSSNASICVKHVNKKTKNMKNLQIHKCLKNPKKKQKEEKKKKHIGGYIGRNANVEHVLKDALDFFNKQLKEIKNVSSDSEEEEKGKEKEQEKEKEKEHDKITDKEKEKGKEKEKEQDKATDKENETNHENIREILETKSEDETDACCVCKKSEAKYKCPHCEYRYCSLICSKNHKNSSICKPAFQKWLKNQKNTTHDYNEDDFYLDYVFLEKISDVVKNYYKYMKILDGQYTFFSNINPKELHKCLKERNIKLHKVPSLISTHIENETHIKNNIIYWKTTLNFVYSNYTLSESVFNENWTFCKIINFISENDEEIKKKILLYLLNIPAVHITIIKKDNTKQKEEKETSFYPASSTIREILSEVGWELSESPVFLLHIFYKEGEIVQNEKYHEITEKENEKENGNGNGNENRNGNGNENRNGNKKRKRKRKKEKKEK